MFIALATHSSVNHRTAGVYKHVESPDFTGLILCYAFEGERVKTIDLVHGDKLPPELYVAMFDPNVTKHGWDGQYERICISRLLGLEGNTYLRPNRWRSLRVWAAAAGYPKSFGKCLEAMNIPDDISASLDAGKQMFCAPEAGRNYMQLLKDNTDYTYYWNIFRGLLGFQVLYLSKIHYLLHESLLPDSEWQNYIIDQQINDRGVQIDNKLVERASEYHQKYRAAYLEQLNKITGLPTPDDPAMFKDWLAGQGIQTDSLSSDAVRKLRKTATGTVDQALALWQMLTRKTGRKYALLQDAACQDGRVRGLFQFNGGRCGKYTGTLMQVDNFPNCHLLELDRMRYAVSHGESLNLETCHETVPEILGELLQTSFIPSPGNSLALIELTNVEDKVLDWLAHSPCMANVKDSTGKSETPEQALFRNLLHVVNTSIQNGSFEQTHGLPIWYDDWTDRLDITLPSGRELYFNSPRIQVMPCGSTITTCTEYDNDGVLRVRELDGQKIARDIVTAIVRDLLMDSLRRLEENDIHVVMHFHNSVLIDAPYKTQLFEACEALHQVPKWALGLQLAFCGYYCHEYYEKTTRVIR